MDRRNFIQHAGRYVLLSAITALGAFGIYKRKKVPADECILAGDCRICADLGSCNLPEAIRQKALQ